jgi:hypothetical protein
MAVAALRAKLAANAEDQHSICYPAVTAEGQGSLPTAQLSAKPLSVLDEADTDENLPKDFNAMNISVPMSSSPSKTHIAAIAEAEPEGGHTNRKGSFETEEGGDDNETFMDQVEEVAEEEESNGVVVCANKYIPLSRTIPLSRFTVFFDYPTTLGISRPQRMVPRPEFDPISQLRPKQFPLRLRFKIGTGCNFNSVITAFKKAGLEKTTGPHWNICWSHHLSHERLRLLRPYQKVNHFPASWAMGRKDRLVKNMARARHRHSSKVYNFLPLSYVLPKDGPMLEIKFRELEPTGALWIIKPIASSCGKGIRVVSKLREIDFGSSCVVSIYVAKPLLIGGRKFDLRLYVCVTCYDPLRIYLYDNGLVRFCTQPYTTSKKSLKKRCTHLTNYSINKKSDDFVKNDDADASDTGGKWSLQALWEYFKKEGIDHEVIKQRIVDVIIKTVIMSEYHVVGAMHHLGLSRGSCFEVFGFDILIDSQYNPWLMEVNIGPSVASSSPLDKMIKTSMTTDMFDLVGLNVVDIKQMKQERDAQLHPKGSKKRPISGAGKRSDRKARSAGVGQRTASTLSRRNMNKRDGGRPSEKVTLTVDGRKQTLRPEDVAILREVAGEYTRSKLGHFERVFPRGRQSDLRLFELERPRNQLVHDWMTLPVDQREAILMRSEAEEYLDLLPSWGNRAPVKAPSPIPAIAPLDTASGYRQHLSSTVSPRSLAAHIPTAFHRPAPKPPSRKLTSAGRPRSTMSSKASTAKVRRTVSVNLGKSKTRAIPVLSY